MVSMTADHDNNIAGVVNEAPQKPLGLKSEPLENGKVSSDEGREGSLQEQIETQRNELEEVREVPTNRIETQRSGHGEFQSEIEKLEKELKIARKLNAQLEIQKTAFEKEKAEMQNNFISVQGNLIEKEKELRDFAIKVEKDKKRATIVANAQIQILQGQVKQMKNIKFANDADYRRVVLAAQFDAKSPNQSEVANDEDSIEALKAENSYLNTELKQLQLELEERKNLSKESQSEDSCKQLEEQRATHESYKSTMENKLNEAERKVRMSKIELNRLREALQARDTLSNEDNFKNEARLDDNQDCADDGQIENWMAAFEREKAEMQDELMKLQRIIADKEKKLKDFAIKVEKEKKREATLANAQIQILQEQMKKMKRSNFENDANYRRIALASQFGTNSPNQSEAMNPEDIIEASKVEIRALNQELKKLRFVLIEQKSSEEALKSDLAKLQEEHDKLKTTYEKEKDSMTDEPMNSQEIIKKDAEESETCKNVEISETETSTKVSSWRTANESLQSENEKLEKALKISRGAIVDLERKMNGQLEDQKVTYEREKAEMKKELRSLDRIIAKKEEELRDHEIEAEMASKREGQMANAQIELLQKQVQELVKNDIDYVRCACTGVDEEDLPSELRGAKTALSAYAKDNNEALKAKSKDPKIDLEQSQVEKKQSSSDKSQLKALHKQLEEQESLYESYKITMETKLDIAEKQVQLFASNLERLQKASQAKESSSNQIQTKIEVRSTASQDDAEVEALQTKVVELQEETITLKKEIDILQGQLVIKDKQISHVKNDDQNKYLSNRHLTNELEQLRKQKGLSGESQSEDLRKQLEEQKAAHDNYKHTMEMKLNKAEKDLQAFARELDPLQEALQLSEVSSKHNQAKTGAKLTESQDKPEVEALQTEVAVLRNEAVSLKKEIDYLQEQLVAKDKQIDHVQSELISVRDNMQKIHAANRLRGSEERGKDSGMSAPQDDSTDKGETQKKLNEECLKQLKEQRALFERIKSGIEAKLGTTQKSLLAKEKEVESCKTELESSRKEIEEYRRVAKDSDAMAYYSKKLEAANREIESLRVDAEKFRSVFGAG